MKTVGLEKSIFSTQPMIEFAKINVLNREK